VTSISLFVSSLAAGGSERVTSVLANAWAERGRSVSLFTFDDGKSDHYALHRAVERRPLDLFSESRNLCDGARNNFRRLRLIRHEVMRRRPAAVISFIDQTNIRVLTALTASGVPIIVSERTDPRHHDPGPLWGRLRCLLYPRAAAVVLQTESVRSGWALDFIPSSRAHVIPNPLRALPAPRNVSDHSKTVLAVGRLGPEKSFDLLLRAFAGSGLPQRGWHLRILGEGPERKTLERLGFELGISADMELPGVAREPADYMEQGAIFVLSSRYEGFPNALLEAMGMGMAAVSFNCESGPAEMIRHDENGFLVPPGDVGALGQTLAQLADDPARRLRVGALARDVRRRYSVDRVLAQWDNLIDRVSRGAWSNTAKRGTSAGT
jgi:glycosyltransferase involved in cell wall biosynthesis